MPRKVQAIAGEELILKKDVQEIYEERIVLHGSGAKVPAQKKDIGKRAYLIVIKD